MRSNLIPLYMYVGPGALPRPERLYDYVLAEQGLIKRVESRAVSVDHLLVPIAERLYGLNLQPYPLQPLVFKLPRIPEYLLLAVLDDARSEIEREVMYHFRFDPEQGWTVTRPAQDQYTARVGYTVDPTGVALDLHSHNRMSAFFSATDDRDEQGGRFYAVIGRLDRSRPELALRLGLYGHWLTNVPALTLFEGLGPFEEVYLPAGETDWAWEDTPTEPDRGWLSTLFNWRSR